MLSFYVFFFFFQAEDGIRDFHVTGVQTCALPIFDEAAISRNLARVHAVVDDANAEEERARDPAVAQHLEDAALHALLVGGERSEERRVGKEWRSRWSAYE